MQPIIPNRRCFTMIGSIVPLGCMDDGEEACHPPWAMQQDEYIINMDTIVSFIQVEFDMETPEPQARQ